jgi:uncharacterized protein (TIGR00369 family)
MKLLPEHGKCFVCGGENPHSMGIRWYKQEDGTILGEICLTDAQQGPPHLAHGGASAALLDEAMGGAVWAAGHRVAAVNLNVSFHRPVPLNTAIRISARVTEQNGKAIHTTGEIRLADGEVAVSATGVYVEAPQLFVRADQSGAAQS